MRYVTAALVTGGATGHRTKDQWTARIAAHLWDLTYVHYPFPQDTWEVNGRLPNEPLWEGFLGFGTNEIYFNQLDLSQLKIVRIDKTEWCGLDLSYVDSIIKAHPEDNVLFLFIESARIMLEQLTPANRQHVIANLRNKYWEARKENPVLSYFNPNHLNVAMHVRRGTDVAPGGRAPWRATADSYYYGIIQNIKAALPQFVIDFHVYSEGPPSIFEGYTKIPNVHLHFCPWPPLNYQDLFTSFHHMITADILVTATSEFSYIVAHMNPNFTITLPVERVCELPKEPRHIKSQPDGYFDRWAMQEYFAGYQLRKKELLLPIYIFTSDDDTTPEIDAARQWALANDLRPIVIKRSMPVEEMKFLQLENPQQRIPQVKEIAALFQQNNFSKILTREGQLVGRCIKGSDYSFMIQ